MPDAGVVFQRKWSNVSLDRNRYGPWNVIRKGDAAPSRRLPTGQSDLEGADRAVQSRAAFVPAPFSCITGLSCELDDFWLEIVLCIWFSSLSSPDVARGWIPWSGLSAGFWKLQVGVGWIPCWVKAFNHVRIVWFSLFCSPNKIGLHPLGVLHTCWLMGLGAWRSRSPCLEMQPHLVN